MLRLGFNRHNGSDRQIPTNTRSAGNRGRAIHLGFTAENHTIRKWCGYRVSAYPDNRTTPLDVAADSCETLAFAASRFS